MTSGSPKLQPLPEQMRHTDKSDLSTQHESRQVNILYIARPSNVREEVLRAHASNSLMSFVTAYERFVCSTEDTPGLNPDTFNLV